MGKKKLNGAATALRPVENGQAKQRTGGVNGDSNDHVTKRHGLEDKTDPLRWRLRDDESRHTWHYLEDDEQIKSWPQSYADKYHLGLPLHLPDLPRPKTPLDAVRNALDFFEKLQMPSGHWACEYGGPMFLLPGMIISWYVTKKIIPWYQASAMKDYIFARAHPDDGGWGLHVEGDSSVFGTSLNYAALRLLGVDAEHPKLVKARATLHKLGGASHAPSWSKFWLAVLGVANWDIVNPVPPELWLLPDWVPFAPWRWWCHIRMPFLAMGCLWSKRWSGEETEVVRALRKEMFVEDWDTMNWVGHRNTIHPMDNYHPKSWLLNSLSWFLVNVWKPVRPRLIANKAVDWSMAMIDMENKNTGFMGLAPVSHAMAMVCCYSRDGPDSHTVRRMQARSEEYMWVNKEGMLCNGTNGVQCWDTAFAIQAVMDAGLTTEPRYRPVLMKALQFLDNQQVREEVPDMDKCYRSPRKGGWTFSNRDQGYAVSDCIAEALKSVILLQKTSGLPTLVDDRRIFDAIDTLLTYQNPSGACSSYEVPRAGTWMEMLNAAEVFGNIMVEYEYPECTTACVTALSLFHNYWPEYRADEINTFVDRAVRWIKTAQKPHGGWYGSWAICFTYATMFALESLSSIGETYDNSDHAKRGCEFLISKQREDGGWSESYKSCELMEYIEHPRGSQVVMTSWALIGLMKAKYPQVEHLKRGIKLLTDRQQPNGEWLQEAIEGVFNKTAMIVYPNYKFQFPMKALGMFARRYPDEAVE